MRTLLFVLMVVVCLSAARVFADTEIVDAVEVSDRTHLLAREFDRDIREGRVRERANLAMNAIIRISAVHLRLHGHRKEAQEILDAWEGQWNGYIMRTRDIGDFKPLSQYLHDTYLKIELILGRDICNMLHISDLHTLNHALPFAFQPCKIDIIEFQKHMSNDPIYRGLYQVLAYWGAYGSCVAFTYGAGYLFICAPVGMGAEFIVDRWIADPLSAAVWSSACSEQ